MTPQLLTREETNEIAQNAEDAYMAMIVLDGRKLDEKELDQFVYAHLMYEDTVKFLNQDK